jgi:hypothetical protein
VYLRFVLDRKVDKRWLILNWVFVSMSGFRPRRVWVLRGRFAVAKNWLIFLR